MLPMATKDTRGTWGFGGWPSTITNQFPCAHRGILETLWGEKGVGSGSDEEGQTSQQKISHRGLQKECNIQSAKILHKKKKKKKKKKKMWKGGTNKLLKSE